MSSTRRPAGARRRRTWALAATAAALGGLGVAALPSQATFAGSNGAIAFERGCQVWTMTASGKRQKRVASLPRRCANLPNWSPDGRKLLYSQRLRSQATGWEIYVMNANGTGKRRLTRNSVPDVSPAFSPNGRRIVFAPRRRPGGRPVDDERHGPQPAPPARRPDRQRRRPGVVAQGRQDPLPVQQDGRRGGLGRQRRRDEPGQADRGLHRLGRRRLGARRQPDRLQLPRRRRQLRHLRDERRRHRDRPRSRAMRPRTSSQASRPTARRSCSAPRARATPSCTRCGPTAPASSASRAIRRRTARRAGSRAEGPSAPWRPAGRRGAKEATAQGIVPCAAAPASPSPSSGTGAAVGPVTVCPPSAREHATAASLRKSDICPVEVWTAQAPDVRSSTVARSGWRRSGNVRAG